MMRVKCLYTEGFALTVGKVYEVKEETERYFHIYDDNSDYCGFFKDKFQVLEDSPRDFLKIVSSFDTDVLKPKVAVRFKFRSDTVYINAIVRLVKGDMLYLVTVDNHNMTIPYELPRRHFEDGTIEFFKVIGEIGE